MDMKKTVCLFALAIIAVAAVNAQGVCGCTDSLANNYNPQATINDGSCTYNATSVSVSSSQELQTVLNGTSGLVFTDGKLYTNADHGSPQLYTIDTADGHILDSVSFSNVMWNDVEDADHDSRYIYLGDHGNNVSGNRTNLHILRVLKSSLATGSPQVDTIWFSYSDQSDFTALSSNSTDFDCEAFTVFGDSIYLFTKQWDSEKTALYSIPKLPGTYSARRIAEWNVSGLVTAATTSPDGDYIVLTGYSSLLQPFVVLLYDFTGTNFFSGNKRKISLSLPFHQVEAIAAAGDRKFYLTNEYITRYGVAIKAKFHKLDLSAYLPAYNTNPPVGLADNFNDEITIYPNPATNKLIVSGLDCEGQRFEIRDSAGRMANSGNMTGNEILLPSKIASGAYVVNIFARNRTFSKTFLVK